MLCPTLKTRIIIKSTIKNNTKHLYLKILKKKKHISKLNSCEIKLETAFKQSKIIIITSNCIVVYIVRKLGKN